MFQFELEHDKDLDADNEKDPRAFCATMPKSTIISSTKYLDALPQSSRVGVLLHEIAHIVENAFGGDECEVDCDVWIQEKVPEANYQYVDVQYLRDGRNVTARSLQVVSRRFLKKLREG